MKPSKCARYQDGTNQWIKLSDPEKKAVPRSVSHGGYFKQSSFHVSLLSFKAAGATLAIS